jgi:DNA-binding CsgD family transcriptional regulator/tetratricopeptide (TPR) repeat protein
MPTVTLLEREADLQQLEDHLRQAAAGHGRVVFLAGEAGVGKTALTDAFYRRIAQEALVLRASCDALSTPAPLGPLRDLAPTLGIHLDRYPSDHDGRDRLFRAVLDALVIGSQPTVVLAEDAHWADGATVELLRFLARRIGEHSLLAIVTYRDDEIDASHPLRLLLGDLATASSVHRLGLLPLSEESVRQIADGSGRDPATLHRLTGGNPFFVTEVLATDSEHVPATVSDAVLARAARLSPEARAILDVAAAIGSIIDLNLLQRIAGPSLDAVDECIVLGLLRGTGHGLSFRHALAREAIFAAISSPRRRQLHARVLAALRYAPAADQDVALLAHHADRDAVLEFAIAAAEQATALYAHREAAAQYARALRFAGNLPAAERARLCEGRSIACYLSDQGEEAIAARLAALEIWRDLGDPLKEGESLSWLSRCCWYWGQGVEAESAAVAAVEVLEPLTPSPQLAMAYSTIAQLRMLGHDFEGAILWGNRAITLAEQLGETNTLVHALNNVGSARALAGDERGEEDLRRSLQLALDHRLPDHAGRALTNLVWTRIWHPQLAEADRRLAAAIEYAIEHDLDVYRWYLLATRAALRTRQGEWDEVEADVRYLLDQPRVSPVTRIVALTALGQVLVRRGNPDAVCVLDEALALAEQNGQLMRLGPVRAVRSEAALLAGDGQRARAEALAVRELVFTRGSRWDQGEFAWLLWQAGDRDVPTGREEIAEPYALQIAGDYAGAAAIWDELGYPYEEARALAASDDRDAVRRAAATFERLGAQPAMRQAIQRLRSLGVRDLPAVPRGPRAATRANPAGLTPREAEVLALLTDGLRNAEIAERLFLSPNTVRRHVSVILAKLGVETRTEAARAATQLGIIPS